MKRDETLERKKEDVANFENKSNKRHFQNGVNVVFLSIYFFFVRPNIFSLVKHGRHCGCPKSAHTYDRLENQMTIKN